MSRTKQTLSIISFGVSIVVGLCAMFIPPPGIIDLSILWWIAQLLAFTAGLLGVEIDIRGLASSRKLKQREEDD